MLVPSVSGMFEAKLSMHGVSPSSASFSQEYASALETPAASGSEPFFEMNIAPTADTAASSGAQALGYTPPQVFYTAAAAARAVKTYSKLYRLYDYGAAAGAASSGAEGAELVAWAKQFIGTPYVRGGEDLVKGADCSGFTQSVFKQFGVNLPRSAYRQSLTGTPVDPSDLQPGDLMFFKNDDYAPVTHVAIYAGDGKILHASSVKTGVILSKLKQNWQTGDFVCAKRML